MPSTSGPGGYSREQSRPNPFLNGVCVLVEETLYKYMNVIYQG